MHADFLRSFFGKAGQFDFQKTYYFFVGFFTLVTSVTMLFSEPGPLILLSAVIGFVVPLLPRLLTPV